MTKSRSAGARREASTSRRQAAASTPKATGGKSSAPISDDALARATGRDWAEWCRLLDAEGAMKLTHPAIARLVHEKFTGGAWWSQMVAVGYERALAALVQGVR